jgi:hypothetical protein
MKGNIMGKHKLLELKEDIFSEKYKAQQKGLMYSFAI